MIIGIGTDMVDARRIERLLEERAEQFITRIYTKTEAAYADAANNQARRLLRYANRYAAKEATLKALGNPQGISWQDIEVQKNEHGQPHLMLSGQAASTAQHLVPASAQLVTHLSLSDEHPYSLAFVTLSTTVTS